MDEVPEGRCGYITDYDSSSTTPSNICCWRPVWRSTKRCIWHADIAGKPSNQLKRGAGASSERLDGAILRGSQVDKLNLKNCILFKADFSNSILRDADMSESWIQHTDFSNSDLRGVKIQDTKLNRCDFSSSNLGEAEITRSTLFQVDFSQVDFTMAKMADLEGEGVDFSGTWFKWAEFGNSKIRYAIFEGAEVPNVDFNGSDFPKSEFANSELHGSHFERSELPSSNFSDAELQEVNFTDANVRRSKFKGADLEDATFIRTELREANLRNARLYQTLFSDTRINNNTDFGDKSAYEDRDTELGESYEDTSQWEAAAWVYRRLQDLHEENAMSEQAQKYHVQKEEAHRRDYWEKGQYFQWGVYTLNRYLTNHGESLKHIVAWSIGIIVACGLLYPFTGGMETANGIERATSASNLSPGLFAQSFYYSMVTFTTLGYGNPAGTGAKLLVGLESLAGTLLIALFVFVLGRRVAR